VLKFSWSPWRWQPTIAAINGSCEERSAFNVFSKHGLLRFTRVARILLGKIGTVKDMATTVIGILSPNLQLFLRSDEHAAPE
jgi:hypothetical protein